MACIHKVTISARQGVSLCVVIFFFTTSMQSLVPLITICTSPRTIHHGREKNNRNLLRGIVERILAVRENLVICAHLWMLRPDGRSVWNIAAIKVIFSSKGNSFNGNEFSRFCVYYFSPNGVDKDSFLTPFSKENNWCLSRAVIVKNNYFSSNQVVSFFFSAFF